MGGSLVGLLGFLAGGVRTAKSFHVKCRLEWRAKSRSRLFSSEIFNYQNQVFQRLRGLPLQEIRQKLFSEALH